MSLTLGEKLRQAREARGMSVSNVSEQTRIASHHLAAIERDDYAGLPGGIFNKGFIRSFAKCVGVDEKEVLDDYAAATASGSADKESEELFTPDVYTDSDGASGKLMPMLLVIALIGLLGAGLIAAAYYFLEGNSEPDPRPQSKVEPEDTAPATPPVPTQSSQAEEFKVEIKGNQEALQFFYEMDGEKVQRSLEPGESAMLEPRNSLKLSFYRTIAPLIRLSLNGKPISLPKPRGKTLELVIDRTNLGRIVESGAFSVSESEAQEVETESAPERPAANAPAVNTGANRNPGANTGQRSEANGGRRATPPSGNSNRPANARPRPTPRAETSPGN